MIDFESIKKLKKKNQINTSIVEQLITNAVSNIRNQKYFLLTSFNLNFNLHISFKA